MVSYHDLYLGGRQRPTIEVRLIPILNTLFFKSRWERSHIGSLMVPKSPPHIYELPATHTSLFSIPESLPPILSFFLESDFTLSCWGSAFFPVIYQRSTSCRSTPSFVYIIIVHFISGCKWNCQPLLRFCSSQRLRRAICMHLKGVCRWSLSGLKLWYRHDVLWNNRRKVPNSGAGYIYIFFLELSWGRNMQAAQMAGYWQGGCRNALTMGSREGTRW